MSLYFNSNNIDQITGNVKFNSNAAKFVNTNNAQVWKKITCRCDQNCLCDSHYSVGSCTCNSDVCGCDDEDGCGCDKHCNNCPDGEDCRGDGCCDYQCGCHANCDCHGDCDCDNVCRCDPYGVSNGECLCNANKCTELYT